MCNSCNEYADTHHQKRKRTAITVVSSSSATHHSCIRRASCANLHINPLLDLWRKLTYWVCRMMMPKGAFVVVAAALMLLLQNHPATEAAAELQDLLDSSSAALAGGAGTGGGGYKCNFDMFEGMGVCNDKDYKACCSSVKTALYAGCLCSTVFQDYIRYCIVVTRELNDYLDKNCLPDESQIDQIECYRNLTYHERHDRSEYSICPLISPSPTSPPPQDDRVSPWKWFWNTSGTLPAHGGGDPESDTASPASPGTGAAAAASAAHAFAATASTSLLVTTICSSLLVAVWNL